MQRGRNLNYVPLHSCNCCCKGLLAVVEYLLFRKYLTQLIRPLLRKQTGT